MKELLENLWDKDMEFRKNNWTTGYDKSITDNRDVFLSDIEKEILLYCKKYMKGKPTEFDGVVWKYEDLGVSIEYQLYYYEYPDNTNWYMNAIVYPEWDQPGFPDDEEFAEVVLTIDGESMKSIIRDMKIESLGI